MAVQPANLFSVLGLAMRRFVIKDRCSSRHGPKMTYTSESDCRQALPDW
jgi:hypothetical protein